MAQRLMDKISAVGVSRAIKSNNVTEHTVNVDFASLGAVKIFAVTVKLQGSDSREELNTGVISDPVIAIGSTAERFANGAFDYQIDNVSYSKAVVAAGSLFSAAHAISASKWGIILLYIDTSGSISSLVPLATQAYDTAAEAHIAGDAVVTLKGTILIGKILINNDASLWTANTDDLTNASDVTTATFISVTSNFRDLVTHVFTADEIIAQKAVFHVANKGAKFIRTYLSLLTGTGEVNVLWSLAGNRNR